MDYLDRLAAFVEAVDAERLSDTALRAARLVLLDTIGAMVAGSAMPENRRLAEAMHERRSRATATLVGHAGKADPLLATFVNATAGVALEVDEGSRLGGGHPAIHVIPGALAVAEDTGADGRRLLESIIAGYEVCSRLGGATTPRPNVHSHGTWGTIGTAVAVAKLAGLDAAGVRSVINLSASMSPANTWTTALEGVTIRNAYPGRSGLEGHPRGGSPSRAGSPAWPTPRATSTARSWPTASSPRARWTASAARCAIEQNYFKLYACCRYNHFALDALLAMAKAERLEPAAGRARDRDHDPVRPAHGRARARVHAGGEVLHPLRGRGRARARPGRRRARSRSRRSPIRASGRWPPAWRCGWIRRCRRAAVGLSDRAGRGGLEGRPHPVRLHHRGARRLRAIPSRPRR